MGAHLKALRAELDTLLGRKLDDPSFDLHADEITRLVVDLVSAAAI